MNFDLDINYNYILFIYPRLKDIKMLIHSVYIIHLNQNLTQN